MKIEKYDLYKYFGIKKPDGACAMITAYLHGVSDEVNLKRKRPAMLVIGGGAYAMVSFREMEPVAVEFFAKGYNCFTLDYSVSPVRYPSQLIEGCMAVAFIREKAQEFGVVDDNVAAIGFSAGGHLVGMLATLYEESAVKEALKEKAELCRPNAVILSYPVITSGEKSHAGSIKNLTGGDAQLVERVSLENRVNEKSVPAFIWTTANDGCVPSENSLLMALAYKKANLPFELHVFEKGNHGISLDTKECSVNPSAFNASKDISCWTTLVEKWLSSRGFAIID